MSNLSKALEYASKGINVFPCKPESKAPRPRNGHHDATTDAAKIRRWWKKNPTDLIGGVCDNTFTVVDVDCGGVCPSEQKEIILDAVKRLEKEGIITSSTPKVKTKSGGYHYYFNTTKKITRKINYLPAIDILAKGGYVILPDETVYTSLNTSLLDSFGSLADIDIDTIDSLHEEYDDIRKEVKYYIDIAKGKKPRKPSKKKKTVYERKEIAEDEENIYASLGEPSETIDPAEELLDENGKLHIDSYILNTDTINGLFHNRQIQTTLAKFLGLKVPTINGSCKFQKGSLQRSVLVGHNDESPSMGLRWAKADTHVIARDFSDHHGDGLCDYNVVRLYMNRMYGENIKKPSSAEWVTWFLRMMWDAGILDASHTMHELPDLVAIFGNQKKKIEAAKSVFLLDAIKRLHSNYSDELPLSKRFMKAWCKGVHPNTSYMAIKELEKAGIIKHTNTIELTKKKSLYLYTIITTENQYIVKSHAQKQSELEDKRKNRKSLISILDEKQSRRAQLNESQEEIEDQSEEKEEEMTDEISKTKAGSMERLIAVSKERRRRIDAMSEEEKKANMSPLERWMDTADFSSHEPVDMAALDDAGDDWSDIVWEEEEDEDGLNSKNKRPP